MSKTMTMQSLRLKQIYTSESSFTYELYREVSKFFTLNKSDFDLATHQLWNKYVNCEIAYDTKEAFERNLLNYATELIPPYITKLKWFREMYSMSLEELRKGDITILNSASNPNEKIDDPLDTYLDYIEHQDTSSTKLSKFDRLNEAISTNRQLTTRRFLDSFANLFIKVYDTSSFNDYLYKEEQ